MEIVKQRLNSMLCAAFEAGMSDKPRFHESRIRHGRLHLSCVDVTSFTWVQTAIASITVPGEGDTQLHLELALPSQIPRRLRAEVYISGTPMGVPCFTCFMRCQNTGLHPERWLLRHQQSTTHGQLMVWLIDQESADALAAIDDRPFCGIGGRVTFRVSRPSSQRGVGS